MPDSPLATSYVKAKYGYPTRSNRIRLIVVHDMESAVSNQTAESCARYFQTITRPASAHYCVDPDSIVQCWPDMGTAFHAPGANNDGLGIEMAGFARNSRQDWLNEHAVLERCAKLVIDRARAHNVPLVHLTDQQLAAGYAGIVDHSAVSRTYKRSDHSDTGPNFPWDVFMGLVTQQETAVPLPAGPWLVCKGYSPEYDYLKGLAEMAPVATTGPNLIRNCHVFPVDKDHPETWPPFPGWSVFVGMTHAGYENVAGANANETLKLVLKRFGLE
jgi:hypothetical protein